MKKLVAFLVVIFVLATTPAYAFQASTKNPKAGQFCSKKENGLKVKNLQCKSDGSRFRWIALTNNSANSFGKMPNREFKFMSDYLAALKKAGVDCTNYVKDSEPGLGAREGGSCTWNGQSLTLTLGAGNNSQMKELVNAFKSLVTGYILLKQNWMISLEDGETAKLLSEKLGMEVV